MNRPNGIDGLTGREPIGAAVTIGIKSSRGFPTEKDKFHIVSPRDVDGVRPHLPAFNFFNGPDVPKEFRKTIKGNIMHRERSQCFEHRLALQAFPKGYAPPRTHQHMRPVCEGDGHIAVRWMQKEDEFANIKCPNQQCEFRQMDPPACKPFARFLFRLRWSKDTLPTPLVKFTTRSWESTANILGFFEQLETAAKELGIGSPTLYGFPFTMTLIERTKAARKARYPVIVISPDQDPVTFFLMQKERLQALAGPQPLALPDMQDGATVYEDISSVEIPKP